MTKLLLPRPLAPKKRVRTPFLVSAALMLGLIFGSSEVRAQLAQGGNRIVAQILAVDGSTVVNAGDTTNNALRVRMVATDVASGGTASNFGSAVPSSGTAAGYSDGTNLQAARAFDGDSGAGTQYVLGATLRKVASGGTVEAGTATDPLRTDPTGTTTQPVSGTVTAAAATVASANNAGACVNVTTSSTSLLSSFGTRKYALIQNQGTATVYVKFGATATTSNFPLAPGAAFSWPGEVSYTGAVDAIASTGTQSVCVSEW